MASARIDARQVEAFQRRLDTAARIVETEADRFEDEWGERLAEGMRGGAPVETGALRASIQQVEPGGISIGVDYWRFVEYGTARMAPRSFVRPAMNRIRKPATDAAGDRALRLISKG